jgi:hypothetical protein
MKFSPRKRFGGARIGAGRPDEKGREAIPIDHASREVSGLRQRKKILDHVQFRFEVRWRLRRRRNYGVVVEIDAIWQNQNFRIDPSCGK